jgi:micrococcal nuclease
MYEYKATVLKVIDGDTVDVRVDLGFHIFQDMRLRLYRIDAPELRGKTEEERKAAVLARSFLGQLLPVGKTLRVMTLKDKTEKFGRFLAELYLTDAIGDEPSVNQMMIDAGHGVPYDGGKR